MSETSHHSSENDNCQKPQGSRKRQVHNEVERRRKDKINGWISKISELLPNKEIQKSKISILEETVDYIKLLASERDKLLVKSYSEVQAEEIKRLKQDVQILLEKNALYEKLLEQSNVAVNSLPRKDYKYSNKFTRTNGVLTVKNTESESNVHSSVDIAVQVDDMCLNIPASSSVTSCTSSSKVCPKTTSKSSKASARSAPSVSKPVKILSATTSSPVVQPSAPISCIQSNSSPQCTLITQTIPQSNNASQENVPVINWNESVRNSTSLHVGGVTTVLSQFPVMSTTHGSSFSSVCNKNVPTFIIPSGGSILQHFPTEKPSNTISFICPSTLPILVPQQVLSVPSVARNVGLQPTIICPGHVDSHTPHIEKSPMGGTLLTINPSSIVPISSSLLASTRFVLPSQSTVLGNTSGNTNLTQNIMTPFVTTVSQTQSDNLIVPLFQKSPIISHSKNKEAPASDKSSSSGTKTDDSSKTETVENALEATKNIPALSTKTSASETSKEARSFAKSISKKKQKKPRRVLRNLILNSPPSLQVLSANKIICFANKSLKVRSNLPLPLNRKTIENTSSGLLLVTDNKSNEPTDDCLEMETSVDKTPLRETGESSESSKKSTPETDIEYSKLLVSTTSKSSFSLTVLMGDTLAATDSQHPKNSKYCKSPPSTASDMSAVQITNASENATCDIDAPLESVTLANAESVAVSSLAKGNVNDSGISEQSNSCSLTNSESESVATSKEMEFKNPSKTAPKTLNNLSVETVANNLCSFSDLSATNVMTSTSCTSDSRNLMQKQNSLNSNFSSESIVQSSKTIESIQNEQNQSSMCTEIDNPINNACNENVPYSESSANQTQLPVYSHNQINNLNSSVLVCHVEHGNTSDILLSQNIHVSNDSGQNLNPCLLHDSNSDFQNFTVTSKDLVLPNPMTAVLNEHPKTVHENSSHFSTNPTMGNTSADTSDRTLGADKNSTFQTENSSKEFPASKKKCKSTLQECKINSNDKILSSVDTPDISNNSSPNKSQNDAINSFPKSDSSSCTKQDSNFIFTSDILARATESIFGNDMLESPQMLKRNDGSYADESLNLNAPLSTDKTLDNGYKLQYSYVREDQNASEPSSEKSKKDIPASNIQHSSEISSLNLQSDERNVQELGSKQNKLCKMRKSKAIGDSEPPCKKMKEMVQSSEKSVEHTFSSSHQIDKENVKSTSSVHSNLSFLEKQVSSEEEQSGIGTIGNFANQIQLLDNSCKTPSSVDTIFSLTPMLGDILKDVSHNTNLDSRNASFLMSNENQSIFSAEKSLISFNYPNNSNEEYLNLPRMYFPIIPEISSAPVVHVTNVSFAHSVSLCSTQSDSQKLTETHASTDSQNKSNSKKKDILPVFHNSNNVLNLDLTPANNMPKQSECILKVSDSEPQFNIAPVKVTNSSVLFDSQHSGTHSQNISSIYPTNVTSQSSSQYGSRDNFIPPVSHTISFYPTISSSSIQNFPCTTSSQPHVSYHNPSSVGSLPFQTSGNSSISFSSQSVSSKPDNISHSFSSHSISSKPDNLSHSFSTQSISSKSDNHNHSFSSQSVSSKPDNLSHSLCSLLKDNSNVDNRGGTSEAPSQNTSSSSNIAQSKYSALSLISDQTSYSESVSATSCLPQFAQSSAVCSTSASDGQYVSSQSSCSRNPKTSLSYSAESLLQTSCASTEKNKTKNNIRFPLRVAEKKVDRNSIANMHGISDTNIFMPVTSCDISIQNAPLVPLPPVTSFHNFSSAYTICDTAPSTTIFNSVARTQDIPLSLSSDNFLNHINLNVESQMLSNRHEVPSSVPKPHSNIPLPFENHNALYNNCNFLPHVKPALEGSRSSEAPACFQSSSYSNNFTQQNQKPNCCHFSHRAVATNSELSSDMNLPAAVTVASFHNDKSNFQANRSGLQTSFSQSNSNFMGNFFYNTPTSCRDGNEMNIKPSTIRPSQEMFVPDGVRQSIHDQNAVVFNTRKAVTSNRTKSKKQKNTTSTETNVIPTCITNYSSSQDNCNKTNLSYVPNGYFKSTSHPVLPPPAQIQCSQNKISETVPPAVISANPSFNPVLHQQGDNFLNLNFQHPNFTMSPLPRPPTQPLSCSCLTAPIISHTFSSTTHPVPNFNLSNILPDMGCTGNQVSFSPAKFPSNHPLSSSSTQCQTNPTITNSAHIVSHQSCAPSLYPPHPPMVRGTLNPILSHSSQTLIDSQVSLVGTSGPVVSQNTTFAATQNPTFRNVIHSITFPRNDR